ncbi:hypothetical protein ABPG72_000431 [Tetrahymena utriculariae]
MRCLVLLYFFLLHIYKLLAQKYEQDSQMDLDQIIQKEKNENCGEDEIKCMNQCPNVFSMILSATFNSDSRTYNFNDESNNLFILMSNKRFNHGYDRYEIKIYEKTLFNLLFVKNIDKIYSFVGYHQLDQVFYFYTFEDVSQDLVQNRYIDLYEAKQKQDYNMCKENLLKVFDIDKIECKQQQQFRVTKFYEYSYKNDEMKMIKFIPDQYDVDQKQYVCEANIKENKLYCHLYATYEYYIFGYQPVENGINQLQSYVTYFMHTYKFNKNDGIYYNRNYSRKGIIINRQTSVIQNNQLYLLNYLIERSIYKNCPILKIFFYFEFDIYICRNINKEGLLIISLSTNQIVQEVQADSDYKMFVDTNVRFAEFTKTNSQKLFDVKLNYFINFESHDKVVFYNRSIIVFIRKCEGEIDSLCTYLLNANKFNEIIDQNKKYLFSIKRQNNNPEIDIQKSIEFVAAEIDERDNFMIVFVFSLNEQAQHLYKVKIVDLYVGQVQTVNIIYECSNSTITLLKWVEYKKNIYLQNECQSIIINILNSTFYILLSKLQSSIQPNISYNQNTKQIYVYSKMDSLRSKFQIIDVITRQSKIIIQTNTYSIEAIHISMKEYQDLIIFSGEQWEHQFLSSSQNAKYISSGYKQTFNVYQNSSYNYSSSKIFEKTIVANLVSHSNLDYFNLQQKQDNQAAQFLCVFYFLIQKRQINFILDQENGQAPQVDQIGKNILKQTIKMQNQDNSVDKLSVDFSLIEEFQDQMEPKVPDQFIIYSDEMAANQYKEDDKADINSFIDFEDISGGGGDKGKGRIPIKPGFRQSKNIDRFFKSYYVGVTQELQECVNQIHKDQEYYYDELHRVIIFYFSHLCVIDVTAQILTLKKQLNNERKIFYHSQTNSVYIVNLNVKSNILYEKISLPNQVYQHKDQQYKLYQAINAQIEQDFLVITLIYLNDKYIFIQNINDPSLNSFEIENFFLNPCSISAGSYRHEYLKNRVILSSIFSTEIINISQNSTTKSYKLVQIYTRSIDVFQITNKKLEIQPLFCYKYKQNDYFHDLIDFNLVQVQSNKLHILFIFTYKVELQEFFYDVYQSTFVQIYSRILFTNEITDILDASFNFHTFQFTLVARSEQNLYIYEIPVENNYSRKDQIELKKSKYQNSYADSNNNSKQVTCKIDSIYLDSGVESSIEQFKKFYRMIQFVQSIVYPPQFTLLIKLLIYKMQVPLKGITLPSFGHEQKASIIIKQENIFLPTSNFYIDEEVYFEFDSLFFENLMPLQKLKIEKLEIISSQSQSHMTINKIRIIQLTDIFLCQKQKQFSDFSIKFQDIDELIITDLKIFDCNIELVNYLFSFENIREVKIQNVQIQNNKISSLIGFKDLSIFNVYNVTKIQIRNFNFTSNQIFNNVKESVEQLQNRSTKYQQAFTKFQNRLFNIRQIQDLQISSLNFVKNKRVSLIGLSSYTYQDFSNNPYIRIKEKIFKFTFSDSNILFNTLPQYYFFFIKNGEVTINHLRIEGNIIEYSNGDIDNYSTSQQLSNEENIQKMRKGQDIFCFLANKQLYQGGLEIINNELFQNMYLMVVYQVLLHSIVLSNIEGNNYLISILLIQNSNTFISDATVINNVGSNRAVVSIEKQTKVEFINSIFQNNKCSLCQGSVLFISESIFIGINSSYKNNTSDHGGSIAIQNCNERQLFSSIDFIDNSANYGGAISIIQSENIQLNNITFKANRALIGGAIYYQGFYPRGFFEMDSKLMFIDNKATSLGQNIGSFPQSLRLVKVHESIINGRFLEEKRNLNFSTKIDAQQQILINTKNATSGNNKSIYDRMNRDYDKIIFVQNVTSGATLTFQFEIYDEEGNRFYGYKPNIRREIYPIVQTVSTNIVLISSSIHLEEGILFLELEVVGNNQVPLNLEDDYVIVQYQNIFISEKKHESYIELFKQYIYLNFRPCGLGEVYVIYQSQINRKLPLTSVYKCEVCKLGKFSLVAQPNTQTQCQTSTSNAVKQSYGFEIELNQGYWRSHMMSDNFLKCDLKENCNGGESTETNQICHLGHIGPLCEACDIQGIVWNQKFAHSGNHSCTPCNSVTKNTIKILLFILTTFIFIVLVLKSTLKYCMNKIYLKYLAMTGMLIMGCSANKKITSVYVKILMSYVQVLESVRYFGINFIEIFLQGINYVASPLEQVSFSGECFMADIGIDMPLVYFKILFALVTPFVFLFIVLVFYYCLFKLNYIKKEIKNYYSYTSIFYIILLFQNKIVNMLVEVFNRREIDGEVYMKVNLQYRFYDDQHEKYFKYMIFPSLVFWTLGVILSILIVLLKYRKNLQSVKSQFKFGFLYGEYKEDCFYWELLRIFTRVGISMSCNFYHQIPKVSCMLMFLVLVIYLIILYFKKPFIQRQLNNLELLSTLIQMMTVSLTVLIYAQQQYSQQQQKEKTSTLQFVCQAIIVIVNVFFLVYLSFKILLSFIIRWEVSIYKIFGRCLGKKKTNDMNVLKRWSRLRHKVINNFIQNRQQSKKYYKQNLIYSFDYQNDLQRFVQFCSYDLNHLHNFYHTNIPSLTLINLTQKQDKKESNNDLQLYQSEQIIKRSSISEYLNQLIWSDFLVNHSLKNHPPLFLKKYNSSFQSLDDTNELAQYYQDLDQNQSQIIINYAHSSKSYIPPNCNVVNYQQNLNEKENIQISEDSTLIEDSSNQNKNIPNEEQSIILSKTICIELQKQDKQQKS